MGHNIDYNKILRVKMRSEWNWVSGKKNTLPIRQGVLDSSFN